MSYRKMARLSKGAYTRQGGPVVGTLATDAGFVAPKVEVQFTLATWGTCSGCGVQSGDMERDGWIMNDDHTFRCLSCQYGRKCVHCGMTLRMWKCLPDSKDVGMFNAGDVLFQCTNPDCSDHLYTGRINPLEVK